MTRELTAIVERYLALIADLDADPAEFERLVHPDARFVERPCLVSPAGQERGRAATHLRADCSMFFTVRDGRIAGRENFDCYHPVAAA
jgi:ketosteroid isomerase-like protein